MAGKIPHPPHLHKPRLHGTRRLSDVDDVIVGTDGAISTARRATTTAGRVAEESGGISITHPAIKGGPEADTLFDKGLDMVQTPIGIAGTATIFGAPILNAAGRFTHRLGSWTGLNWMQGFGNTLQKPGTYLEKTPLSELGKSGRRKTAANIGSRIFEHAGNAAQKVSDVTGIGVRLASGKIGKIDYHLGLARELKLDIAGAHHSVRPHLKSVQKILDTGKTGRVDMKGLTHAHDKLIKTIEALEKKDIKIAAGKSAKGIAKFQKHIDKALGNYHDAEGIKNIGRTIKNVPKEMAKRSISQNINDWTWIVGSGGSVITTFRSMQKRLHTLKRMEAAAEGVDPSKVSTLGLLLGSGISTPVADARRHWIKSFFALGGVESLGLGLAVKQLRSTRHAGGMVGGAILAAQVAGSMFMRKILGEPQESIYESLELAHNSGQKLPPEAYAALLGIASRRLSAHGGADGAFTKAVAQQYAAENKSPEEVLHELATGKTIWRMEEIKRANQAAKSPAPHAAKDTATDLSGIASAEGLEHRPVVGKHTANERARESVNHVQGPAI